MKLATLLFAVLSASMSVRAIGAGLIPDGLGVNIHFTDEKPGELDMIRAAGFELVRMDLAWNSVEKDKGVYDFAAYDRLIDGIEKRHMRAILIIDYSNRHYDNDQSPCTDEGRAGYAKFAAEAAKHFKGKPVVFEIYNEPNINFWRPAPKASDYALMAIEASKAIHAVDANAVIIGPALSGVDDLTFLETAFKAGVLNYWQAVSVHPYRQHAPEGVEEDYRKLRAMIRKYKPADREVPILSGEWGFSDAWPSFDRDRQANHLARQWLTNLANDIPISIYYDWRDDGPDPKEPEHHFGIVEHKETGDPKQPFTPKPAYLAAKTLMEQLGGLKYNKRLDVGDPAACVLLFGGALDQKLVVWTTRETQDYISLPLSPGKIARVLQDGTRLEPINAVDAGLKVIPTTMPVYYHPEQPNKILRVAAAWERLPLESTEYAGESVGHRYIKLLLRNPLSEPIRISQPLTVPAIIPPGLPAQTTGAVLIDQCLNRIPLTVGFTIDGLSLSQSGEVVVPDAVQVRLIPLTANLNLVEVQNPSGKPANCWGRVRIDNKIYSDFSMSLNEGMRRAQCLVREVGVFGRIRRIQLELGAARSLASILEVVTGFVELDRQQLLLVPEGDEQVKASTRWLDDLPPAILEGAFVPTLGVSYQFDRGWKYLCIKPARDIAPIEGKPLKLGVWVHGDNSNNLLRMRFIDSTNQVFQPDGGRLDFTGWRYIEFPMNGSNCGFWNGAKDGKIHYPIRIETLLLIDSAAKIACEGKVYFASPCLYFEPK